MPGNQRRVVVIAGAGDVGSAVALTLHRAGFAAILCDDVDPPWSRRGMAFTDAWYVGTATLEEGAAVFCASVKSLPAVVHGQRLIGATTWSWTGVAAVLGAVAIVDARMKKRHASDDLRARVPPGVRTIGIGPGFAAGANVDVAVESAWGERMGAVIAEGPTLAFEGEPHPLGGSGRERFVYAPHAERFATGRRIGDPVQRGEIVGALGRTALAAPLAGVLRGLAANGARVAEGGKIIEVDPRGDPTLCFGLGERPAAIARGVLSALHSSAAAIDNEPAHAAPRGLA